MKRSTVWPDFKSTKTCANPRCWVCFPRRQIEYFRPGIKRVKQVTP